MNKVIRELSKEGCDFLNLPIGTTIEILTASIDGSYKSGVVVKAVISGVKLVRFLDSGYIK
jgi:hypothetical protein